MLVDVQLDNEWTKKISPSIPKCCAGFWREAFESSRSKARWVTLFQERKTRESVERKTKENTWKWRKCKQTIDLIPFLFTIKLRLNTLNCLSIENFVFLWKSIGLKWWVNLETLTSRQLIPTSMLRLWIWRVYEIREKLKWRKKLKVDNKVKLTFELHW